MREAEPFYPVCNRNRVIFPQPPGPGPLALSEYPIRDGNPMAETPIHRRATVDAVMALEFFFEKRSDVYVGCDMLMYYREGDVNRNVVPDVWVAFGVPKLPERNNWLIWLEGKGPDFVLDKAILEASTPRNNFTHACLEAISDSGHIRRMPNQMSFSSSSLVDGDSSSSWSSPISSATFGLSPTSASWVSTAS